MSEVRNVCVSAANPGRFNAGVGLVQFRVWSVVVELFSR
jgi:hypothetical protein